MYTATSLTFSIVGKERTGRVFTITAYGVTVSKLLRMLLHYDFRSTCPKLLFQERQRKASQSLEVWVGPH